MFGNGGVLPDPNLGAQIGVQPSGKIIQFAYPPNSTSLHLQRLNPDGSVDTTFGSNGIVVSPIAANAIEPIMQLQSDGKIVLCCNLITTPNCKIELVRLNTDGTLDTTFGNNGVVTQQLSIGNSQPPSLGGRGRRLLHRGRWQDRRRGHRRHF